MRRAILFPVVSLLSAQDTYKSTYDQADAARKRGDLALAIQLYRKAWTLASDDTQSARATFRVGEAYANQGDTKAAMEKEARDSAGAAFREVLVMFVGSGYVSMSYDAELGRG